MALFFKFMKEGKVNPAFRSTEKNSVRYHHFMTFCVWSKCVILLWIGLTHTSTQSWCTKMSFLEGHECFLLTSSWAYSHLKKILLEKILLHSKSVQVYYRVTYLEMCFFYEARVELIHLLMHSESGYGTNFFSRSYIMPELVKEDQEVQKAVQVFMYILFYMLM